MIVDAAGLDRDAAYKLLVGEVLQFHIRDDLYRDGKIDSVARSPLCRLGGPRYASLGEIMTMPAAAVRVNPRSNPLEQ